MNYAVTTLSDGTEVVAAPNYDAESIARARDLGYEGSDHEVVDQMTQDHDSTHQRFANIIGLTDSPTLWVVAHGGPVPPELVDYEERLVLHLQRLKNEGVDVLDLLEGA